MGGRGRGPQRALGPEELRLERVGEGQQRAHDGRAAQRVGPDDQGRAGLEAVLQGQRQPRGGEGRVVCERLEAQRGGVAGQLAAPRACARVALIAVLAPTHEAAVGRVRDEHVAQPPRSSGRKQLPPGLDVERIALHEPYRPSSRASSSRSARPSSRAESAEDLLRSNASPHTHLETHLQEMRACWRGRLC